MATFFSVVAGLLALLLSVTGISGGMVIAAGRRTRREGAFFALMWVPMLAVALGLLWRDGPTVLLGMICFAIAAVALIASNGRRLAGALPFKKKRRAHQRRRPPSKSSE